MPANSKSENNHHRRYWDFRAFFYALFYRIPILSIFARGEHISIRKLSAGLNLKSGCVLDLGCGVRVTDIFGDKFIRIGLDWSLTMLFWARRRSSGWRYLVGDVRQLPLKDVSAAVITAVGISEYMVDPEGCLKEIHRVLSKEGILIFTNAPQRFLNLLRRLWYPALKLRSDDFWVELCENMGFTLRKENKLTFQHQFLFIKM
ncbi:MAG: class I SAM-dependent methyltransferase [candidate division Zixibacteria bacterium]|nr:class I SAM-dependent methyltransferase [Candidatus Tariuqbacter arcticus]